MKHDDDPHAARATHDTLHLLRYGISHELSQPLAAIRLTLAAMEVEHDPELVESELIMSAAVELMQKRVRDLGTLVRLAIDEPVHIPTSVACCADDVVSEAGSPSRGGREDIEVKGAPSILGDPELIRLAVRGLLRTALKVCTDPPILLEAIAVDGHAGVSVRFHGPNPRKTFDVSTAEAVAVRHGGRLEIRTADHITTLSLLVAV